MVTFRFIEAYSNHGEATEAETATTDRAEARLATLTDGVEVFKQRLMTPVELEEASQLVAIATDSVTFWQFIEEVAIHSGGLPTTTAVIDFAIKDSEIPF